MKYKIKKYFTSGMLKGSIISEDTNVSYKVGKEYKACVGSSNYVIVSRIVNR